MFEWLSTSICLFLVVFTLVLFVLLGIIFSSGAAKREAKIYKEGKLTRCWIVMAHPDLYKVNDSAGCSYAQVVFTPGQDSPDLAARMLTVAEKLVAFNPSLTAGEDEQILGSIVKTKAPHFEPVRLPDHLTDGLEVYTVGVRVFWHLLPQKRLAGSEIMCTILLGPDGGALLAREQPGQNWQKEA